MKSMMVLRAAGLVALMIGSASANASCLQTSKIVERVLSYPTYCYVYLRPESALTNTFYYYTRSTSDKICGLAGDAKISRTKVNALGDAASCPASGTSRYMGNTTYIYLLN